MEPRDVSRAPDDIERLSNIAPDQAYRPSPVARETLGGQGAREKALAASSDMIEVLVALAKSGKRPAVRRQAAMDVLSIAGLLKDVPAAQGGSGTVIVIAPSEAPKAAELLSQERLLGSKTGGA